MKSRSLLNNETKVNKAYLFCVLLLPLFSPSNAWGERPAAAQVCASAQELLRRCRLELIYAARLGHGG